jgi:hypothetical protein
MDVEISDSSLAPGQLGFCLELAVTLRYESVVFGAEAVLKPPSAQDPHHSEHHGSDHSDAGHDDGHESQDGHVNFLLSR